MLALGARDANSGSNFMISDIDEKWDTIKSLTKSGHRMVMTTIGPFQETRPSDSYNLPFILCYSLLDEVLSELKERGTFQCDSWMLGRKMEASKNRLGWLDYSLVNEGKNKRNGLAHGGIMLNEEECRKYISAVEVELRAWGGL